MTKLFKFVPAFLAVVLAAALFNAPAQAYSSATVQATQLEELAAPATLEKRSATEVKTAKMMRKRMMMMRSRMMSRARNMMQRARNMRQRMRSRMMRR